MHINTDARKYMIDLARQNGKFAAYSEFVKDLNLGFDLSTYDGLQALKKVMGDVSVYEHSFGRPLLSSLLIYKDPKKNDHGGGFYGIAEQLGKGKAKQLEQELYGFIAAEECRKFWQNEENYRTYAELPSETITGQSKSLFNQADFDFFAEWEEKAYNPKNPDHFAAKNHLLDSVWDKTVRIGFAILKLLPGFAMDGRRYWTQRGWRRDENEKNVQAAIIKPYTWIKLFRKEYQDKDIFFTFGISAKERAFVYKIDCRYQRDSKLSREQIILCKTLVPETALRNRIPYDQLLKLDIETITETCKQFITDHLQRYDDIVKLVWENDYALSSFPNSLILTPKPNGDFDSFPEREHSFRGVEVDYLRQANERKELGNAGEKLVKEFESKCLIEEGRPDLAAKVEIVKDGVGYDVHSYHSNGQDKFIEVKTTCGNEKVGFFLSENEFAFMSKYSDQYYIYRIYGYNEAHNSGKHFIIMPSVADQLLLKPSEYKVILKR